MENEQNVLVFEDNYDDGRIKKNKRKRRIIKVVFFLLLAGGVVGGIYYMKVNKAIDRAPGQREMFGREEGNATQGVMASGITMIGMAEEFFSPDYLDTELEIEEVYLHSGEEVEEHTPILKITESSLEGALRELEHELTNASLAYRAGVLEYEQSEITAKYDYESAVLQGNQAETIYNRTIADLQKKLDDAKEAYEEAAADIAEYEEALANDSYADDYDIEGLREDSQKYYDMVCEYMSQFEEITSADLEAGRIKGAKQDELSLYRELWNLYKETTEQYTKAKEDYQNDIDTANKKLQELYIEIETLNASYIQAIADFETQSVQANATYQTSLAKATLAQDDYDTAIKKAQETLEELKDAKADAQENLDEFKAVIGDGILYTEKQGTVVMIPYENGDELMGNSLVLAYSDTSTVTIRVSVDQSDIAKLTVGDIAEVVISDYGNFKGTITEINPISSSSGRSSITYQVTVTLEGDVKELSANLTAQVVFDVKGDK